MILLTPQMKKVLKMTDLKIKKLYKDSLIPIKANPTDSGFDVFIHHFEKTFTKDGVYYPTPNTDITGVRLKPGDRALAMTGIAVSINPGFEIQIRPRSGKALEFGLSIVNTPGTIDAGFRNEIGVILINLGHDDYTLKIGDKVAQIVVCPIELPEIIEVEDLETTDRWMSGFGSTDK